MGKNDVAESRHWILLAAILALALGLRMWGIDASSLWFDEGWSIHVAQQTIPQAIRILGAAGHTHPPGYYLVLWGWVRLFGCSEIAVRGLSAVLGIVSVWLTYLSAKWLLDARTGLFAALILAISPAHVIYSQETRMYTMLCASLAALWALHGRLVRMRSETRGRKFWALLVVAEICAVYTHFLSVLAIAAMALWTLPALLGDRSPRRWQRVWEYLGCHAMALLAFTPWLGHALSLAASHSTLDAVAPGMASFAWQTWTFLLGGHIALAGREPVFASLAEIAAVSAVALCLWLLVRRRDRRESVYLVFQTVAPCALMWAINQFKPGYHPRYLLMVLPPLSVLLAHGIMTLFTSRIGRGLLAKAAALGLAMALVGAQAAAFRALARDSYYWRDDARSTAKTLAEQLPAGAPVLLDIEDWAIQYYTTDSDLGVYVLDASAPACQVMADVDAALDGHTYAALVRWHQGTTDMRGILGYALERRGHRQSNVALSGYSIELYSLNQQATLVEQSSSSVDWGIIRLGSATCDVGVPADDALAVALVWEVREQLPADLQIALQLRDAQGRQVASRNVLLRDAMGRRSQDWDLGQTLWSFVRIPLPGGLAPLDYGLEVVLYRDDLPEGLDVLDSSGAPAGKSARILNTRLTLPKLDSQPTLPFSPDRAGQIDKLAAENLMLVGYLLDADGFSSGQEVTVELWWHAQNALPDHTIVLELMGGDEVLAAKSGRPVYGLYPTTDWLAGQTVHEFRELLLPPDMPSGKAVLQVRVDRHAPIVLTVINILSVDHSYVAPEPTYAANATFGSFGRLIGYDTQALAVSPSAPITLTLYWEGLANSAEPYVVFAHLLDAGGHLIAQHDGMPMGGERPTTGWKSGEYLVDEHVMAWVVADYVGGAKIEVGLYDPVSGQRVPMADGQTELLLPIDLDVAPNLRNQ